MKRKKLGKCGIREAKWRDHFNKKVLLKTSQLTDQSQKYWIQPAKFKEWCHGWPWNGSFSAKVGADVRFH